MRDLLADIENLESAIFRGVRTAKINGEEVTYASMAELFRALAAAKQELTGTARNKISVITPRTSRGL